MRRTKGYILLEALVGVAIIGIVVVAALQAVAANIAAVEGIRRQSQAVALAQMKMEELGARDGIKSDEEGDFGEAWPGFTWSQRSTSAGSTNFYNLVDIKLTVNYQVRGLSRQTNLESLFITRKPAVRNWN